MEIITAKKARQMYVDSLSTKIDDIYQLITTTATSGKTELTLDTWIDDEVADALKEVGYDVKFWCDQGTFHTTIIW